MCCPTAGCCLQLTAQTLQDEVEFSSSLEGVQQIYDERVPHRLQDLSLCSRMGRVFSVAHYLCLQETKSGRGAWYNDDRDKLKNEKCAMRGRRNSIQDPSTYLFQDLHGKNSPCLSPLNLPHLENLQRKKSSRMLYDCGCIRWDVLKFKSEKSRQILKIWLMEFPQEYDHRLDYLVMYREVIKGNRDQ